MASGKPLIFDGMANRLGKRGDSFGFSATCRRVSALR